MVPAAPGRGYIILARFGAAADLLCARIRARDGSRIRDSHVNALYYGS